MMAEWNSILDKFALCAGKLEAVVAEIPDDALDRSLDQDSWSIRQIIHHLADAALIWSMYYRQVLGDPGGDFNLGWYWARTQDEWAMIWNYSERGIESAVSLYRSCNQSMLELLRAADNPGAEHLCFNFPGEESQTMTVEGTVRWQNIHLKQHLDEIRKILGT